MESPFLGLLGLMLTVLGYDLEEYENSKTERLATKRKNHNSPPLSLETTISKKANFSEKELASNSERLEFRPFKSSEIGNLELLFYLGTESTIQRHMEH